MKKFKKTLAILLVALMLIPYVFARAGVGTLSETAIPAPVKSNALEWFEREQTGDDGTTNWDFIRPVTHKTAVPTGFKGIYTAQDLDYVRHGLSVNYILMNNIDLSSFNEQWEPIGDDMETASFSGIFDGNGYVIKNLSVTRSFKRHCSFGVFGYAKDATIKNVGFVDAKVNIYAHSSFVGFIGTGESIQVENCFSNCLEIIAGSTGMAIAGGIIGHPGQSSSFTNCYNIGYVGATSYTASGAFAGGIIGGGENSSVNVSYCYNFRRIVAANAGLQDKAGIDTDGSFAAAGGIVGYLSFGRSNITDCYNAGSAQAIESLSQSEEGAYAGGIVGRILLPSEQSFDYADIKKCHNIVIPDFEITVNDPDFYSGKVHAKSDKHEDAVSYNRENAGGIIGEGYGVNIEECSNGGAVFGDLAGGIVGNAFYSQSVSGFYFGGINKCWNTGNVYGLVGGGIAGYSQVWIMRCNNSGGARSYGITGGIVGISETLIADCYNKGIIASKEGIMGGIVGQSSGNSLNIRECYVAGTKMTSVDNENKMGGIIGFVDESSTDTRITNCYYLEGFADASSYGANVTESNVVALAKEEMRTQDAYVGFNFEST